MEFKDILDTWERQNPRSQEAEPKDFSPEERSLSERSLSKRAGDRRRLLSKKPDAVIDLHGLTQDEAWTALNDFFETAAQRGLEKVVIIHGKGKHRGPGGEGVLKSLVRTFLERCPLAGESGFNTEREGGSGACWVLVRRKGNNGKY
jgi:DNA-nicking Smr family endonuclease